MNVSTFLLIAYMSMGNGKTLELFGHSANCGPTEYYGAIVNSADLAIVDFCWRVSPEDGHLITTFEGSLKAEDLDWTGAGRAYLRRITR